MANYEEAIKDIRYLSTRLRGLIEVADYLEDVSSLENRVAEKTKTLEQANIDLVNVKNSFYIAKEQLNQTKEDLEVLIKNAYTEAETIRNKAIEETKLLISQAKEAATNEVDKIRATGDLLKANIEKQREELTELTTQLTVKAQALDNIEKKLKTLRESLNG